MDLHVYGRNLDINERTRQHVEGKLKQIDHHLPGISDATVELAYEATRSSKDRFHAQVTLRVGGTLLRAQRRAADVKVAVNSVAKALDQQIERYKGHAYRSERNRRGASEQAGGLLADTSGLDDALLGGLTATEGESSNEPQVIRVKEFDMEPMSVDEAAIQMDLLGHSFFMFLDSESDKHGVLYLRGDGNYGLIQPKSE